MEEKIRSFVALDTAEKVKGEIGELLKEITPRIGYSVKWVKPQHMHLTLVFLGEVSKEFIENAKEQLKTVSKEFRPFKCQLKGLGAFPDTKRARVIWVGINQGEKEIKELQISVSQVLSKIGYVPEKRPFTPHLTLGRVKEPQNVEFIQQIYFSSSPFTVDRMILFKSTLHPTGPEYTKIGEFFFINPYAP